MSLPFLDSNVPVYALTEGDRRQDAATALLAAGGTISVQVLNEVTTVARRKLGFTWPEVCQALAALRALCPPPLPLTMATHEAALSLAEQTGYTLYDALILAAALEAGGETVLTEDMRDGQVIDGRLTIRNPFKSG